MKEVFMPIAIFAIGLFLFFKPEIVWKINHFWTTKGGEPSEMYLKYTKFMGGVAIIIGIVFLMMLIFY